MRKPKEAPLLHDHHDDPDPEIRGMAERDERFPGVFLLEVGEDGETKTTAERLPGGWKIADWELTEPMTPPLDGQYWFARSFHTQPDDYILRLASLQMMLGTEGARPVPDGRLVVNVELEDGRTLAVSWLPGMEVPPMLVHAMHAVQGNLLRAGLTVLDTELGEIACAGSDAPVESALGLLHLAVREQVATHEPELGGLVGELLATARKLWGDDFGRLSIGNRVKR